MKLRIEPNEEGGLLHPRGSRRFTLAEACGYMAPALDFDLDARTGETLERVINANDWKTMPGVDLLRRITEHVNYERVFPRAHQTLENLGSGLQQIVAGGDILARAVLAPSPPVAITAENYVSASACVTIGGLRAGSNLGGLAGIVTGRPTTADRASYELAVAREDWAPWASEQASRWAADVNAARRSNNDEAGIVSNLVLRLGGNPAEMLIAQTKEGFVTLERFRSWASDREVVTFVGSFGVDSHVAQDGQVLVWHRQSHEQLTLGDDIVLGDYGARYGSWDEYGDENPDKTFRSDVSDSGEPKSARGHYYNIQLQTEGALIRELARAWSLELADLLDKIKLIKLNEQVPLGVTQDGTWLKTAIASWRAERSSDG